MDNNINENAVVNQPAEPTLTEAPEYAQPTYTQPDLAEPVVEAAAETAAEIAEPVAEAAVEEPVAEAITVGFVETEAAAAPVAEAAPAAEAPVAQPAPSAIPVYQQPVYTQPQQPVYTQPQQPVYAQPQTNINSKSKIAAGLLGIFLGGLGVHNFYLGYTGKAIAQLLISLLSCGLLAFVSAIWGLIEGIMILAGSITTDANGVPLSE